MIRERLKAIYPILEAYKEGKVIVVTSPKPIYSERVDPHIYLGVRADSGCQTTEDWIQLAFAALDQAGLSVEAQREVEGLVRSRID